MNFVNVLISDARTRHKFTIFSRILKSIRASEDCWGLSSVLCFLCLYPIELGEIPQLLLNTQCDLSVLPAV